MEKAITVEDRIRRAEEIYYRRHNQVLNNSAIKQDIVSTSKHKIVKKVTIQAFIAACVFTSIFIALNNEKCSETVKQNINYVLSSIISCITFPTLLVISFKALSLFWFKFFSSLWQFYFGFFHLKTQV